MSAKPGMQSLEDQLAEAIAARDAYAEGNRKLTMAVDACRLALQEMAAAEWDQAQMREVTGADLRRMAKEFLKRMGWSRRPVVESFAGDRSLPAG